MVPLFCQGIARTQSPTTKNCTPEFPTFGGIADFSQARCTALASIWAACLRDHKQPAPGKLIKVCQLGRYEEAAVFNTCGSPITQQVTFDVTIHSQLSTHVHTVGHGCTYICTACDNDVNVPFLQNDCRTKVTTSVVPFVERIYRFRISFIERKETNETLCNHLEQFRYDCAKAMQWGAPNR